MHHGQSLATVLMVMLSSMEPSAHAAPPAPPVGYTWVPIAAFTDEFHGEHLDASKWLDHHPHWKGRPPAKFMPDTISLQNGVLQIRNRILDPPEGPFHIAGGAVVSTSPEAHFGYYEVRMKASKISMSSTFWFSNRADPDDPLRATQELDVQEAVGGGKRVPDRRHYMKSNTHYRCRDDGQSVTRSVPGEIRITPAADEDFHVYGVWWIDANTIRFYHNDQFAFSIEPDTTFDPSPFDRPMQLNLVTETYDWESPPTPADLNNDLINTTFYDWVRAYRLVPTAGGT